jgi:hypothetical protein
MNSRLCRAGIVFAGMLAGAQATAAPALWVQLSIGHSLATVH